MHLTEKFLRGRTKRGRRECSRARASHRAGYDSGAANAGLYRNARDARQSDDAVNRTYGDGLADDVELGSGSLLPRSHCWLEQVAEPWRVQRPSSTAQQSAEQILAFQLLFGEVCECKSRRRGIVPLSESNGVLAPSNAWHCASLSC